MALFLSDDEKRQIIACIDAFAWKHSWHLSAGPHGLLWDDATLEKVSEIMTEYRDKARPFASKCDSLIRVVAEVQLACKMADAEESSTGGLK